MGRRVIAIIVALVVALLGASAVVAYASSADERAVADQQVQSVYIAQAAVPQGTSLQQAVAKKLITPQEVVAKGVPEGALTQVRPGTAAQVALSTISKGEVVLAARFGPKLVAAQAAPLVTKGRVAITVTLPDPQRIAPLLEPGAHIVIYDTFNPRDAKASSPTPDGAHLTDDKTGVRATRVLLADVEVIGVGDKREGVSAPTPSASASSDGSANSQSGSSSALVTVAVSPSDAMVLVHGVQTGTLYAGLLGADVTVDAKKNITDNTVLGR
jgi:pilus assembly protein CpaB